MAARALATGACRMPRRSRREGTCLAGQEEEALYGVTWATLSVRVPRHSRHRGSGFRETRGPGHSSLSGVLSGLTDALQRSGLTFSVTDLKKAFPDGADDANLAVMRAASAEGGLAPVAFRFAWPATLAFSGPMKADGPPNTIFAFEPRLGDASGETTLPLDFLIRRDTPTGDAEEAALAEAGKVVMGLLASRRWDIFSSDLAARTYQLGLPAGLIVTEEDALSFAAVPVLTLTCRRGRAEFRRSISVSLLLFPVRREAGLPAAAIRPEGWRDALGNGYAPPGSAARSPHFRLDGDLSTFVSSLGTGELDLSRSWPLPDLLGAIAQAAVNLLLDRREGRGERDLSRRVWAATSLGVLRGAVLLPNDLDTQWLARMIAEGTSETRHTPRGLRALVGALRLSGGELGSSLILTPYGQMGREVLCHFPDSACTLALRSWTADDTPGSDTMRVVGALLTMSAGLATVRSMIYFFHHEVANERRSETLGELLTEFIVDLDEAYDLDLRAPWYKFAYERVKELSGLEGDFERVKSSVETTVAQVNAAEIQMSTRATVALTVVIALGTLASVGAGTLPHGWRVVVFALLGLALATSAWIAGTFVWRYLAVRWRG